MSGDRNGFPSPYHATPEAIDECAFPERVEILGLKSDEDGESLTGECDAPEAQAKLAVMLDDMEATRIGFLGYPTTG